MKRVLIVFVLIMAVLAVNAQTTVTTQKVTAVRTTVMVVDLQQAITDNIAKDYVGYTVKEAVKVAENDVVTYEVVVIKDDKTETLVYDNEGKFVKKLPPVEEKK